MMTMFFGCQTFPFWRRTLACFTWIGHDENH